MDGCDVGWIDGEVVGESDGCNDAFWDGDLDGEDDGTTDGLVDGNVLDESMEQLMVPKREMPMDLVLVSMKDCAMEIPTEK